MLEGVCNLANKIDLKGRVSLQLDSDFRSCLCPLLPRTTKEPQHPSSVKHWSTDQVVTGLNGFGVSELVSDMGFTAHQHKKAISCRKRYKRIRPLCIKS